MGYLKRCCEVWYFPYMGEAQNQFIKHSTKPKFHGIAYTGRPHSDI
jgi:hypothetical protein